VICCSGDVDVHEQAIDYCLPPDTASEPAAFDGSVIAERTKGELLAGRAVGAARGRAGQLPGAQPAHDLVAGRLGSTRHAGDTPSNPADPTS
jgi:hypothetical protein